MLFAKIVLILALLGAAVLGLAMRVRAWWRDRTGGPRD
ncbi:hypothetical protein JOF28_002706 [Leucobacter exalbidus]|uniref:Uncharacterized protein n=1 Tax=Leucobacter exalbidus TaxID=662960 RepID=A0A940PY26_9MICO|nr:hypothetical protein [Leucobacter exalbidus]